MNDPWRAAQQRMKIAGAGVGISSRAMRPLRVQSVCFQELNFAIFEGTGFRAPAGRAVAGMKKGASAGEW
jgi:hypothetical protein